MNSQSPKLPASKRMPTWLLVACAQWNKACKKELELRNALFKERVLKVSRLGDSGKRMLGDIANLYRMGIMLVLGCIGVSIVGILDFMVNQRWSYVAFVPVGFVAMCTCLIKMEASLEKLWDDVAVFLDNPPSSEAK